MNTCPKCGASNPPFNDVCRLCDAPLLAEKALAIPADDEVLEVLPLSPEPAKPVEQQSTPRADEILEVIPLMPEPAVPSPVATAVPASKSSAWSTVGLVFLRIGQVLLILFLLNLIVQMFVNGYRISSVRFEMRSQFVHGVGWVPMPSSSKPAPFPTNGTFLVLGLLMIGLSIFVLNAMFRRRSAAVGWLDRLLGRAWFAIGLAVVVIAGVFLPTFLSSEYGNQFWLAEKGDELPHVSVGLLAAIAAVAAMFLIVFAFVSSCRHAAMPAALVTLACVYLPQLLATELKWHADPVEALQPLTAEKAKVYQAGDFLYRLDDDERVHVVRVTPDLVRALDRQHFSLYSSRDLPLPGFVPLAFPLAIGMLTLLARWRWPDRSDAISARAMAIFALAHLFVIWWLLAASARGHTIGSFFLLPILSLITLGLHWSKRRNAALSPAMSAGWVTLYFAVHVATVAAVYLPIGKDPGSPMRWWIWAYTAGCGFLWLVTLPRKTNRVLTAVAA